MLFQQKPLPQMEMEMLHEKGRKTAIEEIDRYKMFSLYAE
jgi:hypothetical protein